MNKIKADFFDRNANSPWSSADYLPEEREKIIWMFDRIALGPGLQVLEPGCGTGRTTGWIADRVGTDGYVMSLDISAGMVTRAKLRIGRRKNAGVIHSSLEETPYAPSNFDIILCFNSFPHFDDKDWAMDIMSQALKPGGRLAIYHLENSDDVNDRHLDYGPPIDHDWLPEEGELKAMFASAGLRLTEFRDDDRYFALAVKP